MKPSTLALRILTVLLALAFVASAAGKLAGPPMMREEFALFGLPYGVAYAIAVVEIVSSVLLFTRWFVYGAGALVIVGLGAAFMHATHGEAGHGIAPLVLALLAGVAIRLKSGAGSPAPSSPA